MIIYLPIFIYLLYAILPFYQQETPKTLTPVYGVINPEILENKVNEFRHKANLSPLWVSRNSDLCKFSEIRAKEIKTNWSHEGFRIHNQLCDIISCYYEKLGENLARDLMTEDEIIEAWIHSPLHYIQLTGDYNSMCVSSNNGYVALNLLK